MQSMVDMVCHERVLPWLFSVSEMALTSSCVDFHPHGYHSAEVT